MKLHSPKFSWVYWYWTKADENIFELTPEEWYLFKLFVKEANK